MKSPKAPSPAVAAVFSSCEGGIFHRHDYIQYCGIDNTFQTRSGKIASELAKKGYDVRVISRRVVDKCTFCGTYTLGREVCPGCGGKTTVDTYEIVAKKKG